MDIKDKLDEHTLDYALDNEENLRVALSVIKNTEKIQGGFFRELLEKVAGSFDSSDYAHEIDENVRNRPALLIRKSNWKEKCGLAIEDNPGLGIICGIWADPGAVTLTRFPQEKSRRWWPVYYDLHTFLDDKELSGGWRNNAKAQWSIKKALEKDGALDELIKNFRALDERLSNVLMKQD